MFGICQKMNKIRKRPYANRPYTANKSCTQPQDAVLKAKPQLADFADNWGQTA